MARRYTLKRRAEQQAETRLRIVEAAVELHSSVGPARTSFSMVAERAGVQRHTLYAHFPDERSLLTACSGLTMERDPPPDPECWRDIASVEDRLKVGLGAVYAWFGRNADLAGCVLRDAEHHALTRETVGLSIAPRMAACRASLEDGLQPAQRAMLGLALGFQTWRTLTRDEGLTQDAALAAMVGAVVGAAARRDDGDDAEA